MKTLLTNIRAGMPALVSALLFLFAQKSLSQDSLTNQDFEKGVPGSSFHGTPGDQSVILTWAAASFPTSGAMQGGYLLIYSTSTPTLASSQNGLTPDFAVLNGTIVPTTATYLPVQPGTSATAGGLTNGFTYNFLVVAYLWDGIHTTSYQYSSCATICVTIPPDGPVDLNLPIYGTSANYISGSFSTPLIQPDGYLVVYSTSPSEPAMTSGHFYKQGETFGMDTIAQVGMATSFSTINSGYDLAPSTTYYIYVFSCKLSACSKLPVYSLAFLQDSITTLFSTLHGFEMLVYFTAVKAAGYNKLTWLATGSASSLKFEAQRSVDSVHFKGIYTVTMSNIAQSPQPFSYNDFTDMGAKLYYRIKFTDPNGQIGYSKIIGVADQNNNIEIFRLEQNPTQGDAVLLVSTVVNNILGLTIFSIDGKEVMHKIVQVQSGANTIHLLTSGFATGIYIIKGVFSTGQSNVVAFIKQ
jgi:hypothetical protein